MYSVSKEILISLASNVQDWFRHKTKKNAEHLARDFVSIRDYFHEISILILEVATRSFRIKIPVLWNGPKQREPPFAATPWKQYDSAAVMCDTCQLVGDILVIGKLPIVEAPNCGGSMWEAVSPHEYVHGDYHCAHIPVPLLGLKNSNSTRSVHLHFYTSEACWICWIWGSRMGEYWNLLFWSAVQNGEGPTNSVWEITNEDKHWTRRIGGLTYPVVQKDQEKTIASVKPLKRSN
jgi:hypothetical protein